MINEIVPVWLVVAKIKRGGHRGGREKGKGENRKLVAKERI